MRRLAPSREKIEEAIRHYPSASFLSLLAARATPIPDAPLKILATVQAAARQVCASGRQYAQIGKELRAACARAGFPYGG